jgi:predicted tellurium resistance membrane protein TerC
MILKILKDAAVITLGWIGLAVGVVHTHHFAAAAAGQKHVIAVGITAAYALAMIFDFAWRVRRQRRAIDQQPTRGY